MSVSGISNTRSNKRPTLTLYWPSTTWPQAVPTYNDPVLPSTSQYCLKIFPIMNCSDVSMFCNANSQQIELFVYRFHMKCKSVIHFIKILKNTGSQFDIAGSDKSMKNWLPLKCVDHFEDKMHKYALLPPSPPSQAVIFLSVSVPLLDMLALCTLILALAKSFTRTYLWVRYWVRLSQASRTLWSLFLGTSHVFLNPKSE